MIKKFLSYKDESLL